MGQTTRQLGQALAENCLVLSKLRRWKDLTKEEVHKVYELIQRVEDLQMMHQETKALLTEKSKEALELSAKNAELHAEVEKLKEELARRGEKLVQKDELLEKTKEDLTNDAANSYMVGFDDAVTQATCIYPDLDFSQLGLSKIVVDG
ncbi:hypothetical protein VNO80_03148 [Phaseolus coccineus]|uniref:Uncharacterized protein n=1 Tax=Phaseolus coccineus TaxID=3886 RepID=A0AAN9RND2_PHACN